jgi:ribosomal subunit interface protein
MNVSISWRHTEGVKTIEEYISKKVRYFEKFSHRIKRIKVIINKEKQRFKIELEIKLNKVPPLFVQSTGYELRDTIDTCLHKGERKIKEYEKKVKSYRP